MAAFEDMGFKRAYEVNSKRKSLSITSSGGDFLNVVVVDKLPSGLQAPEKRGGVRAALYVSDDFKQYKFYLTRLVAGKEPSYTFTASILKSVTQLGNLARTKINNLEFNNLNSIHEITETSSELAIQNFEENLGAVIESLRKEIVSKISNEPTLKTHMNETVVTFSSFIGPEFDYSALIELLIQHLLTKDIFAAAYGRTFQHDNVVAKSLESLAISFADIPTLVFDKHDIRERRDAIIQVIELNPIEKRLEIIKLVYETFYAVYNPLDADRLGIVYTPKIAVDFIIRSTDKLMFKYLHANFANKDINVIDPCIGTGTFMISLLNYMNQEACVNVKSLASKYTNEIYANEVSILAYYIAAMNVERTFESITGLSKSFRGIVWRDTLLTVNLDDFPVRGNDNVARMKAQHKRKITVIVGNPPYNAGQKNFGDGNPNPTYRSTYGGVDDRITETYHKKSQFRKQTRDMYKRFVRWASDQIGERGIISFISNNSFIHANNYDGMRRCLEDEFDFIYICDLRGNANTRGVQRKKEGGGFFGEKSKVGIAIYFLIKTGKQTNERCKIYYADIGDYKTQEQKFAWIKNKTIDDVVFNQIITKMDSRWIGKPADMDYRKLVPLISFDTKRGKCNDALFQLFTNGIMTGADDWQTDFDPKNLEKKLVLYTKEYNRIRQRCVQDRENIVDYTKKSSIPWYSGLDKKALGDKIMKFDSTKIFPFTYRPFVIKHFQYDAVSAQTLSKWPDIIQQNTDVPIICVRARSPHKLECIGAKGFIDRVVILHSQNIPLYKIGTNGKAVTNLTDYGRKLFRTHYKNPNISDEDVFYYCYAVLNDPIYVEKYGYETRTLHPRIPLHPEFYEWCHVGKTLFGVHANFKQQPKHRLRQINEGGDPTKFILNLAPSTSGMWKARIDESCSIDGIPAKAADPKSGGYVIGARTPIEWALEYYQKACKVSKRANVPAQIAALDFECHRDGIIDLVCRLCTVSLKTFQLQNKISKLPHSFFPCGKLCCESLSSASQTRKNHLTKKRRTAQEIGQKRL